MPAFTDLYEAYLHWKEEGGFLLDGGNGTFVVTEEHPGRELEYGNDFGIFSDVFEPPISRDLFCRQYPTLPVDPVPAGAGGGTQAETQAA